jgi:hypothetical protein
MATAPAGSTMFLCAMNALPRWRKSVLGRQFSMASEARKGVMLFDYILS